MGPAGFLERAPEDEAERQDRRDEARDEKYEQPPGPGFDRNRRGDITGNRNQDRRDAVACMGLPGVSGPPLMRVYSGTPTLISPGFQDEQGVVVAHPKHLLTPPPGTRRWTALAGHQQGQVARR